MTDTHNWPSSQLGRTDEGPQVHPDWPADEAAALRAVLTECPAHTDLTSALWGAAVALQRRRGVPPENAEAVVPCGWCGRAIKAGAIFDWYAVKGVERGYPPDQCDASDNGKHHPPDNADREAI
jgi:hypothetical protein